MTYRYCYWIVCWYIRFFSLLKSRQSSYFYCYNLVFVDSTFVYCDHKNVFFRRELSYCWSADWLAKKPYSWLPSLEGQPGTSSSAVICIVNAPSFRQDLVLGSTWISYSSRIYFASFLCWTKILLYSWFSAKLAINKLIWLWKELG